MAGVAQLDVVADVWQAMDQAIDQGLPFKDFKAAVRGKLERAWGGTVGNPGYRIETIFRVQVQEAYNAGRWRQMTEPAVLRARPFWLYDAVLDRRTTAICRERDGKIYRADDPWWQTNYPPLHFRCRSGVRTLSAAEAEEFGGVSQAKPRTEPYSGFGLAPDRGEWQPKASKYPPLLWSTYTSKVHQSPAQEVERIRKGSQIGAIYSDGTISAKDRDKVLRALEVAGFDQWLKDPAHALGGVQFKRGLRTKSGKPATAIYDPPPDRLIGLNTARLKKEIRQPLKPGMTYALSDTGKSLVEALRRSLIHELGHHLHHLYPDIEQDVRLVWRKGFGVTDRAGSSWKEYLCETLAAYVFERKALKAFDPEGYKMIEDILEKLGIKA